MVRSRFLLGQVVATRGALAAVPAEEISTALARHRAGDWGELDEHDRQENELAVCTGKRLLSTYRSAAGTKFWIITEWDRSATTVLLPEEY